MLRKLKLNKKKLIISIHDRRKMRAKFNNSKALDIRAWDYEKKHWWLEGRKALKDDKHEILVREFIFLIFI